MGPPSQETERFRGSKVHFEATFLGNFPNEKAWDRRENSPATPHYRVLM